MLLKNTSNLHSQITETRRYYADSTQIDYSFPYHVWDYIPNAVLSNYIDKLHDRSKPLNIFCTHEIDIDAMWRHPDDLPSYNFNWDNTDVNIVYASDYRQVVPISSQKRMFNMYNPNIHYFAMFWLYQTYADMAIMDKDPFMKEWDFKPTKHFICRNRGERHHRTALLYSLGEKGLLDGNFYSLLYTPHPTNTGYDLSNYSREINLSDFKLKQKTLPEDGDVNHHADYYRFSPGVVHSAIDIVTETSDDTLFYTEKTFRNLITGKPFLIFGAPRINSILKSYGYKLFDNIVDYSFDFIEDDVERLKKFTEEIYRLCSNYSPKELYNSCKHTAIHNRIHSFEILKKRDFIPQIFLDWHKKYSGNIWFDRHIGKWYSEVYENLFFWKQT